MNADPKTCRDCIMQSVLAMFGLTKATFACTLSVSLLGYGQSMFKSVAKDWNWMYVIKTLVTDALRL